MNRRRLVLLRHGRTAWNATGRAQGHADVELDRTGHAQAAEAAPHLAVLRPSVLWTSDLTRARQTCGYIEQATGLVPVADGRLREFDVGDRQGMTSSEFAEAYPEAYAAWRAGEDMARVPNSEPADEVAARIVPALRECLDSMAAGETGVVVTHGASLKVGLVGLLGWSVSAAVALRGVDNCAWVTVGEAEPGGRLRLEDYNQRGGADFASSMPVG